MRVDPDSRGVQGLTGFLEFVALNVVYVLCCLPVVTAGAATSALLEVTLRYSDDERGRPLPDFFPALRRNFAPATVASLILGLPVVLLVFSAIFWIGQGSVVAGAAGVIAVMAAVYLSAAWLYAMALVARYASPLRQTLRNALLLPGAEPVRTFALLLVPVTVVALAIVFPPVWILVLTIGFSVGAYGASFLLRSVFSRH